MAALTGMWVSFFTAAGIPSDVGATYAISFTENRIQSDMLLDLNKEYLRDMGITRMGDVIAILRHAKLVHENTARERVLSTAGPAPRVPVAAVPAQSKPVRASAAASASSAPPSKPSSPASRMLEHYTRKLPEAAVVSLSSAAPPPNVSVKRTIADAGGSSKDAKRVRHIEIRTNSESSATDQKKNVFSRLGGTSESSKVEGSKENPEPKTIFSRLGNKSLTVNVGEIRRSVKQEEGNQALQYEGILKTLPEIKKVVFSSVQETALRKSVSGGTMRADEAPISVKEKLAIQKTKTVKFSSHVDYKEIEPLPKKRIFFQSLNAKPSKPEREETPVFNKPERRLTMPSGSGPSVPALKARLGTKPFQDIQRNVFTRLGQP